jgi:signal transduction histidine kinase
MSKEMLAKIFEPFFTTKRPGKGIGLGLVIAKTIIDNHRGKLEIASEEGRGTTAKVSLPIA